MGERCARCGHTGEDRRTLWMACFYEMQELGLPFGESAVLGRPMRKVGDAEVRLAGFSHRYPTFELVPESEEREHRFYTLRVCKRCRAEWMTAIRTWFHASPAGEDYDADDEVPAADGANLVVIDDGIKSGTVYVRDLGIARPATPAEIEAMQTRRTD